MAATLLDERTALVLIDLQAGTLGGPKVPHSGAEVLAKAVALAEAFRAAGAPVVLVRMGFAAEGGDAIPGRSERQRSGSRLPDLGPLAAELAGHDGDILVTKKSWGAFYGTGLDMELRRRGITQIVLAGLATSLGVESTARAAHEHGYHVTLASDAMADLLPSAHENSVGWVFPLLGEVGTTAEILDLFATSRR